MKNNRGSGDQDILDLSQVTCEDFDGHTAFAEMTAEQRLLWLSHAAEFVKQFGGITKVKTPILCSSYSKDEKS